jgi:hypothetical protein
LVCSDCGGDVRGQCGGLAVVADTAYVDYFDETEPTARSPWPRQRVLYWAWRLLKNLLGAVLLLAGFVMLFTPGQGILTILAGLWLMDLPGKRRWERNLISRNKVLTSINWTRQKFGQPPLRLKSQPSNDRTK